MKSSKSSRNSLSYAGILFLSLFMAFAPCLAEAKNVIVLMTDGTGSTHTTITRWYKGGPLALDEMFLSGYRTYGADSIITDSAPSATAHATGFKTSDKFIGVLPKEVTIPTLPPIPEELKYKPVATVLEGAKVKGKSAGLVATSNIQHASPAAYSAHWPDRGNYNEIAQQQVYLDIDVVFGGGKQYLLPISAGGKRTDGENLLDVLKSRGYGVVENRMDMQKFKGKKVWGLFADDAMAYEFDRREIYPEQPSLAEMTAKAIEILSQNKLGFFLFVEASKVDWASHANDPIGVISDVLAFDEAVKVALEFAKKDGETLVLAYSDHGNGGMSLGSKKTDNTYSKLGVGPLVDPLKKAKLTGEGVEAMLNSEFSNEDAIRRAMEQFYGISDLTSEEVAAIMGAKKGSLNYIIGPMISSRSVIGWTTNGHTGEDLFFYYYGYPKPMRIMENTDIAHLCAEFLGFDLNWMNKRLFVKAEEAFEPLGATVKIDKTTDPANPALLVENAKGQARLPLGTDLFICGDQWVHPMEGLSILAGPGTNYEKVFVPQQAENLFRTCGRGR
ncbi:MAG: alkaline phosphatase [Syntrophaceae bacterium]|jgi:alkaline phosphatase|nr:alkaline phosphatase [Syntrophaceae bacterium]